MYRQKWLVRPHRLEFAALKGVNYTVYDHWLDIPDDAYMYSSAFTECIAARERALSAGTEFLRTVRLKVRASQLRAGQHLALVGAAEYLGAWDYKRALPMTEHEYNEWVISLDADRVPSDFEFKFIILDNEKNVQPVWEESANRCLHLPDMERNAVVVYELPHANFAVYPWKGAGTVIPVFSLRSEGSFGVGDFGDLKQMVNWCAKTQQRVLQVLPINDTTINHTWQDSYPYNAISIYALHPQYMDLRQLPELKDKEQRERFEALRQELNALPQIDYERMMAAKIEYMQRVFAQEGTKLKRTTAYKEFVERNKEWLEPYARFCFYRDLYGTATFSLWPKKLAKPEQKVLDFWFFVQYHLDAQMRSTHEHARQQRISGKKHEIQNLSRFIRHGIAGPCNVKIMFGVQSAVQPESVDQPIVSPADQPDPGSHGGMQHQAPQAEEQHGDIFPCLKIITKYAVQFRLQAALPRAAQKQYQSGNKQHAAENGCRNAHFRSPPSSCLLQGYAHPFRMSTVY